MNYFLHKSAIIDQGATIGEASKIWHWVHVCAGAKIGSNVTLGQNVFVANNVTIGDGCKVQNNVSIYDNVYLNENVFFKELIRGVQRRCHLPWWLSIFQRGSRQQIQQQP